MIEAGADIKIANHFRITPLHLACSCPAAEKNVVRFLLEKGANVEAQKYNGQTPYWDAVRMGTAEVRKKLIEYGVDTHHTDPDGCVPMHASLSNTSTPIEEHILNISSLVDFDFTC